LTSDGIPDESSEAVRSETFMSETLQPVAASARPSVDQPVDQPEQRPDDVAPLTAVSEFRIGDLVVVEGQLPFLKSADPMPMLRPPDLVDSGEQGQVLEIRAMDQLAIRFRRGTFLIATRQLRRV
jgi:hypothetical protein